MIKLDLLKYPIMMISIVVGLLLAKWLLEIDFSKITKIGPQGIELDQTRKDVLDAVLELTARINSLEKKTIASQYPRANIDTLLLRAEFDEVSDVVSQLSKSQSKSTGTVLLGRQGYIFIGNYDSTSGHWERAILKIGKDSEQSVAVTLAPDQLQVSGRFFVDANMVLRESLPKNDLQYFKRVDNIGVIPRGTLVALRGRPVGIDRNFAVQYWAHVEVLE